MLLLLTLDQFISFQSNEQLPSRSSATTSARLALTPIAFVKEGAKPVEGANPKGAKTKKSKRAKAPTAASWSPWKVNPNTGRMMDMMEDEDWSLCDKDCGWCGRCAEGVDY
jgi:hypothetical protein